MNISIIPADAGRKNRLLFCRTYRSTIARSHGCVKFADGSRLCQHHDTSDAAEGLPGGICIEYYAAKPVHYSGLAKKALVPKSLRSRQYLRFLRRVNREAPQPHHAYNKLYAW